MYYVQIANKWPPLMEFEGLLSCSQEPPRVRILSHINPIDILKSYVFKIRFNIIIPFTPSYSEYYTLFRTKFCTYFLSFPCDLHILPIPLSLIC
jgi:hypothetical protein